MVQALLVWLEEFATRLVQGGYRAENIVPGANLSRGVSLFPASGETVTRAVTRGIEVVASSIYMAEHRQGWTYSIRIRLLTPGEEGYMSPEERGFTTGEGSQCMACLGSKACLVADGRGWGSCLLSCCLCSSIAVASLGD